MEQQLILKEAEKKAIEEERNHLKDDLANTHLAKDELIKKVKLDLKSIKIFIVFVFLGLGHAR